MVRKIPLTKNKYAIVDDEDYERLSQWKWHFDGVYARRSTPDKDKKCVNMHRLLCDFPVGKQIDHINGDQLDNRKCNLRICTRQQNHWNRSINLSPKSSKYKGVYWENERQKWRAYIYKNNKRINIGRFLTEQEAANAYNKYAINMFGEFARLNAV